MIRRTLTALSWLPVAAVLSQTVATVHPMRSAAMSPAIPADAFALVTRTTQPENLSRGEALLVSEPSGKKSHVRRLVALPGDYVTHAPTSLRANVVPRGFLWLEPDAREPGVAMEVDSMSYGPVPVSLVTGRVTRLLPSGKLVEKQLSDTVVQPSHPYS